MKNPIPNPSIERLCLMYHLLEQMEENGIQKISSAELGRNLCVNANSIRKDISYLGEIGNCRAGYYIKNLREFISVKLQINRKRKSCIVGLGRLGTAILEYDRLAKNGFGIVAGFDSNINKIETIQTKVPLFPASEIAAKVRQEGIDLGVLAVPATAARDSAKRLIEGGIVGIVNFSPIVLKPEKGIFIRNIDLVGEMRIVSILSTLSKETIN
jgi:redox-sensing transcriptional repressor